jgi:hypothetical protein
MLLVRRSASAPHRRVAAAARAHNAGTINEQPAEERTDARRTLPRYTSALPVNAALSHHRCYSTLRSSLVSSGCATIMRHECGAASTARSGWLRVGRGGVPSRASSFDLAPLTDEYFAESTEGAQQAGVQKGDAPPGEERDSDTIGLSGPRVSPSIRLSALSSYLHLLPDAASTAHLLENAVVEEEQVVYGEAFQHAPLRTRMKTDRKFTVRPRMHAAQSRVRIATGCT